MDAVSLAKPSTDSLLDPIFEKITAEAMGSGMGSGKGRGNSRKQSILDDQCKCPVEDLQILQCSQMSTAADQSLSAILDEDDEDEFQPLLPLAQGCVDVCHLLHEPVVDVDDGLRKSDLHVEASTDMDWFPARFLKDHLVPVYPNRDDQDCSGMFHTFWDGSKLPDISANLDGKSKCVKMLKPQGPYTRVFVKIVNQYGFEVVFGWFPVFSDGAPTFVKDDG